MSIKPPIVFAHNVYNRFDCLVDTIKAEKNFVATHENNLTSSHSVVAYNDVNPNSFVSEKIDEGVEYHPFPGITHKIGCVNGCITSIQNALQYYEKNEFFVTKPNVIIFSHDDVRINPEYNQIVKDNIEMIISGEYDVIVRKPANIYGKEYYMMEVFYMSYSAAEKCFNGVQLFKNEDELPRDPRGSISPEVWLYRILNDKMLNILEIEYHHQLEGYNKTLGETLGYYHEMIGERGWTRENKES
jgi:hypothetical protein